MAEEEEEKPKELLRHGRNLNPQPQSPAPSALSNRSWRPAPGSCDFKKLQSSCLLALLSAEVKSNEKESQWGQNSNLRQRIRRQMAISFKASSARLG